MPPLSADLRNRLEKAVIAAREVAESAAQAVLATLAVARDSFFTTMSQEQRALRNALRAMARQLGGGNQTTGMPLLVQEIAYHQWHRLLFARFLAENNLLMHPQGVAVSLQDCADLAREEGATDAWEVAARYTGLMLPGLFATDDPAAQVRLAPEDRHALERLVQELPVAVFTADDSLGWVYQFWQTKKKDEINHSERKIGGADIGPVTQLFTEDYMVRFLLENSLGAWWAARHPDSPLLKTFTYLRYREDGTPAAGAFPGWPERAALVTVMDPSGGSGHFILVGSEMLRRMRMEEEGLNEASAGEAVIRDNLYMLELDPRCTQIAAFALLFAAWKAGGYRDLPVPNIACSGIAVEGQLEDWLKLANGNSRQRTALERLYQLFRQAPTLGSLIDPTHVPIAERMFSADYDDVAPLFEQALLRERKLTDPAAVIMGQVAAGVAKAATLLAGKYTLVATNVPYLGLIRQDDILRVFCEQNHPEAKTDLATVFVERCRQFAAVDGSYALVTPQYWLFLGSYKRMRKRFLLEQTWNHVSRLGAGAFETIGGAVVNVALVVLTNHRSPDRNRITGLDVSAVKTGQAKADHLLLEPLLFFSQASQITNPDARVTFREVAKETQLLGSYGRVLQGVGTTDTPRFVVRFWEIGAIDDRWVYYQLAPNHEEFSGYTSLLKWEVGTGDLARIGTAHKGKQALGRRGFAISVNQTPNVAAFLGTRFDCTVAVLLVNDEKNFAAVRAFLRSPTFQSEVRIVDQALSITESSFTKVPFDIGLWHKIAAAMDPLPEPHSDDPTQWLFEGHPVGSTEPLQVAVARLLGYRWPQQKPDELEGLVDNDGIVCLPPVAGEQAAAERLRSFLATAYGADWSQVVQQQLLTQVGFKDQGLDEWLHDGFITQHCKLFHNRPFIWHIWDGRKDGFGALVNYHRLDAPTLDKLIYTYLGNWIETQRAERERGVAGADGRLVAAIELKRKLELIRDGEAVRDGETIGDSEKSYDIYVRWKPLHQQPIGWNPDLNDGVRLNIRPLVEAGVLRSKFTINWNKDRGKNPDGSERENDVHLTLAEKWAARESNEALKAGTR